VKDNSKVSKFSKRTTTLAGFKASKDKGTLFKDAEPIWKPYGSKIE
jgi:hypothetical protein